MSPSSFFDRTREDEDIPNTNVFTERKNEYPICRELQRPIETWTYDETSDLDEHVKFIEVLLNFVRVNSPEKY